MAFSASAIVDVLILNVQSFFAKIYVLWISKIEQAGFVVIEHARR
jgi:hypothetical protein